MDSPRSPEQPPENTEQIDWENLGPKQDLDSLARQWFRRSFEHSGRGSETLAHIAEVEGYDLASHDEDDREDFAITIRAIPRVMNRTGSRMEQKLVRDIVRHTLDQAYQENERRDEAERQGIDAITGVYKEEAGEERIKRRYGWGIERSRRAADQTEGVGDVSIGVGRFDKDNFKRVNDTLGHSIGDAVLREGALTIQGVTREEDRPVLMRSSTAGDEFTLALDNISPEGLRALEQRFAAIQREVRDNYARTWQTVRDAFGGYTKEELAMAAVTIEVTEGDESLRWLALKEAVDQPALPIVPIRNLASTTWGFAHGEVSDFDGYLQVKGQAEGRMGGGKDEAHDHLGGAYRKVDE